MLRGLDSLHLSTKYNSDLLPNRGAMPHQPDGPLEPPPPDPTIQAVPKLPRNFYRDDYWNLLAKDAQKRLEVQPSIDLEFSIHITRRVYIHLPSGSLVELTIKQESRAVQGAPSFTR